MRVIFILLVFLFPFSCLAQLKDTINCNGSLNLYSFGAKLDGVSDDSQAWQDAINYATSIKGKSRWIEQPTNTVSRITKSLVIGGDFIPLELCFKNIDSVNCYQCNFNEYLNGIRKINIKITGKGESAIYADFNDTNKLRAAIYIGAMYGRSPASLEQYNLEVSNIGIYAQGYFIAGKRNQNVIDYSNNNVAAIAALFCQGLKVSDMTIYGFKEGIIGNNNYFFDMSAVTFNRCKRGSFDIRCHRGNYTNINTFDCNKGIEIRSNKILLNGLYAMRCITGLHVAGSNNIVNSAYFESPLFTQGQVIIGDSIGGLIEGITFNDLTIASAYPTRIGMWLRNNVKNITINDGIMQSQYVVYDNLNSRIYAKTVLGNLPTAITVRANFIDINGKTIL